MHIFFVCFKQITFGLLQKCNSIAFLVTKKYIFVFDSFVYFEEDQIVSVSTANRFFDGFIIKATVTRTF